MLTGILLMSLLFPTDVPPPTRTEKLTELLHGQSVPDPYRWLEQDQSPEVQQWTEQQNAYTRKLLDAVPQRQALGKRLEELLAIGTVSPAVPRKGRYFYTKRTGTQNQPILYVRESVHGPDRILVDPNTLSAAGTTSLDWWYPNPEGNLVAYGLSAGGSELSTLHLRDVVSGKDLADQIPRCRACAVAWLPDGSGFYYTRYPAPGTVPAGEETYHRHVYFHNLGDVPEKDAKVFGAGLKKEDWPSVTLSPDGRWLVLEVHLGWTKNLVFLHDRQQGGAFRQITPEAEEALYSVTVRNDALYIHTNEGAPRYRLFRCDPQQPQREKWQEVLSEGPDVLEGVAVMGNNINALYMVRASSRLRVFDLHGKQRQEIPLPTLGSITGLGGEWEGNELFYGFTSFTVPPSIYRLDLHTLESTLWQRVEGKFDTQGLIVRQVEYLSKDSTPVTMFLVHHKDLHRTGQHPTLLTGYGGFNSSETPVFRSDMILFLEQGGVLALANLRGGGEYGEAWHRAGMLDKKQNVFDDFLAAAQWLIREKITSPPKLAIKGGSNGGLLIGAALTQRPDLFRTAVCQVPLLDMLRFHKFRIARLWIPEYGDPENPKEFPWLLAYSPYHHVQPGVKYPAVLFTAAESDTRVDPMHARKMAARLQAATTSGLPVLLRLETQAGHGAGKPRSKVLAELTDVWSFVFQQLGMEVRP
jgi:prolyl oligopeptidase